MASFFRFIRITATILLIVIACVVGFIMYLLPPYDTSIGPYRDFVIDDVSKPQTFIIPAEVIPPVVLRYRIEGIVDDSASVSFRTSNYHYGHAKFKGVIADSAIRDFYERSDMQIRYEPNGAKEGHLVVKATLNW